MLTKRWYGYKELRDVMSIVFTDDMRECYTHAYTRECVLLAYKVYMRTSRFNHDPFFDTLKLMGDIYHDEIGDSDYWVPYKRYMDEDECMEPIGEDDTADTFHAILKWFDIKEEDK